MTIFLWLQLDPSSNVVAFLQLFSGCIDDSVHFWLCPQMMMLLHEFFKKEIPIARLTQQLINIWIKNFFLSSRRYNRKLSILPGIEKKTGLHTNTHKHTCNKKGNKTSKKLFQQNKHSKKNTF